MTYCKLCYAYIPKGICLHISFNLATVTALVNKYAENL